MIKKVGSILLCSLLFSQAFYAKMQIKKSFKMSKHEQKQSAEHLNRLLANEFVLLMQTLHYHWNLVGEKFHDYHVLFDKQYNQLFANLDIIAERVRAVEQEALRSLHDMVKHASLQEDRGKTPKPKKMIHNLVGQYEQHIHDIKHGIQSLENTQDFGTRKFLEDLLEQHEKTVWMLRSLL